MQYSGYSVLCDLVFAHPVQSSLCLCYDLCAPRVDPHYTYAASTIAEALGAERTREELVPFLTGERN